LKNISTFKVFIFNVISAIGVLPLFSETECLWHHATRVGYRIVVYFDVHDLNKISETRCIFRRHKFSFLQNVHLFVYFFKKKFKLILIAIILFVKFHDPLFKGNNEGLNKKIILILLASCCKSTVDTHIG
jgi:hypothetical protein